MSTEMKLRYKLSPELSDGQHWSIVDTKQDVLKALEAWLDEAVEHEEITLKICLMSDEEVDLVAALKWRDDGYEIAKELDEVYGYCPDAELVAIRNDASSIKREAQDQERKQWMRDCNITAPELQSKVTWSRKPEAGIGIITKNHDDGRSTVSFEKLGHSTDPCNFSGYVIEWEQLTPVP